MHNTVEHVTARIIERSKTSRQGYLDLMNACKDSIPPRKSLSCGNLAHAFAACGADDKQRIAQGEAPNLGIITAYNDMLSAHQPLQSYPDIIKQQANLRGASAQVAAGVPAMCDGVTQGRPGMELSLFSRDVIAMATAVGLCHNMFNGSLFLGVCDKIVPGMLIGALQFGHLPAVFVPAGPMPSGISNKEKAQKRELYAQGIIDDADLLAVEAASYHSPGTCTFYGTANTNQLLMEMLGVQLPGASFVHPQEPLREALTRSAVDKLLLAVTAKKSLALHDVVTPYSLVNAIVGLLASGGSTNHTLHLLTIGRACGIQINWQDLHDLSEVVPLLARVYPNGEADINQFQAAGGTAYFIHELRRGQLLHENVRHLLGEGLQAYTLKPQLLFEESGPAKVQWCEAVTQSNDTVVLRSFGAPFSPSGGLKLLDGNMGQAVIKVSAVAPQRHRVQATAQVFEDQDQVEQAFKSGALDRDVVIVLRFQGPAANGMPEMHRIMPALGALQERGFQVALVTDGRLSGASGKVPAAIHVAPEAVKGGPIAKIQNGDLITVDANIGKLYVDIDADELQSRKAAVMPAIPPSLGRSLFANFRAVVSSADQGADCFGDLYD